MAICDSVQASVKAAISPPTESLFFFVHADHDRCKVISHVEGNRDLFTGL